MTTTQEPAMGVSEEAIRAAWMAFTGRDVLDPSHANDADHMPEDERRDIQDALLAALPHMQPAGEAVALYAMFRALVGAGGAATVARHGAMPRPEALTKALQDGMLAIERMFHPERFDDFPTTPPSVRQEAQGAVAVGEIDEGEDGMFASFYPDRDLRRGAKLYTTPPAPVDVRLRELAEKYSTRAKNWRSQRSEYAAGNAKQAEDIEDDLRALLSAQQPRADAGEWPTGVLARDRTLEILRQHNEWRRGADTEQTDPRLLGLALDAAIAAIAAQPRGGK